MKLDEIFNKGKLIYAYNDYAVYDSNHATERFINRLSKDISMDDLCEIVFKQMIKRVTRLDSTGKLKNDEMLIYSKKLHVGVVVAFDDRLRGTKKSFHVITYLPINHHTTKQGTPEIVVEQYQSQYQIIMV